MKVHYLDIVAGCPRFAPILWALTWASQTSAPQRV